MENPAVFISYSRQDGEFAHRLADDLRAGGYSVWIDVSGLRGGEVWVREIEEAVAGCDVVVLVLSPDSVASDWVRNETIYAQGLKKPVIPIMWRDVHLPIYLVNVQYIDFRDVYEDALQKLYEALPPLPSLPSTPEPIPEPIEEKPKPAEEEATTERDVPEGGPGLVEYFLVLVLLAVVVIAVLAFLPRLFRSEPEAGTVREIGGVEMVYVPAGTFEMGSESGSNDEKPVHTVDLDTFWIDRYEVTNAQYVEFLNAIGGHTDQCAGQPCIDTGLEDEASHIQLDNGRYGVESGYEDHPIVEVSWYGAQAYCEWRGRNASEEVRLPTEAEWEKAARGTDGRIYPWGNSDPDGSKLNFCDVNCESDDKDASVDDGYARTAPVGSYEAGKSPYGAYDMAGNVWEWVADWYGSDYYNQFPSSESPASNPRGPSSGDYRVLRGGAWRYLQFNTRATDRNNNTPDVTFSVIGVRCAASPAIDRVVHHSIIIEFGKEISSLRAEEAARRNKEVFSPSAASKNVAQQVNIQDDGKDVSG